MKKYLIITLILSGLSANVLAANNGFNTTIGRIEDSLYGFQYNGESTSSRLNRLEKEVYGKVSNNKSEADRIAKLSKDLAANEMGN